MLLENGTDDCLKYESEIKSIVLKNQFVFVFDVRGIGGVKSRKVNSFEYEKIYGTEFKYTSDALMLGTSLVGMRVYDVLRAYQYLCSRKDIDKIGIIGKGVGALYALFTAMIEQKIEPIILEDMLYSYMDIINTRYYKHIESLAIYGIVKEFDIVDLISSIDNRKYRLINLRDAKGKRMTKRGGEE